MNGNTPITEASFPIYFHSCILHSFTFLLEIFDLAFSIRFYLCQSIPSYLHNVHFTGRQGPFDGPVDFQSPKPYDYSKTTENNFQTDEIEFVGEFASQRAALDYSYHKHYIPERQLFHDVVMKGFYRTVVMDARTGQLCDIPTDNWIVFTAGPMGAGKSRVLAYLYNKGYFPLQSFVRVDPDTIRMLLPETENYIAQDPTTVGRMTQKEVNFICEVLTLHALENGKNVLVDGSLRDATWYFQYFNNLRAKFPKLKIAILHVTADTQAILERARKRGEITGRVVPEIVLKNTIEALPSSMALLAPLADLVTVFENNDDKPLTISHMSERTAEHECTAQPHHIFYESDWAEDGTTSSGFYFSSLQPTPLPIFQKVFRWSAFFSENLAVTSILFTCRKGLKSPRTNSLENRYSMLLGMYGI